jgi:D-alanine-D-alanine ligase
VLELVPKREFYDYEAKYTKGMTDLICPARIPEEAAGRAQEVAVRAHKACGCHGLSRVDMHHDSQGRVWVHEINSVPGLTETSDVPAEARAAGMDYGDLVEEILESALVRMRAAC